MEKTKTEKMPSIYTFVDYSKAFDSLVWARMWDILEFQGCPAPLIAVIRALHEAATIALRINSEGDIYSTRIRAEEGHPSRVWALAVLVRARA